MKSKLIYTGIRVKDLDDSIAFYTKLLGMKEIGRAKVEIAGGEVVSSGQRGWRPRDRAKLLSEGQQVLLGVRSWRGGRPPGLQGRKSGPGPGGSCKGRLSNSPRYEG